MAGLILAAPASGSGKTTLTLGLYALLGNKITASTAFPALSLLMLLRAPLQVHTYSLYIG